MHVSRRKGHGKMTKGCDKVNGCLGEDCTKGCLTLRGPLYSFVKEDKSL